MLSLLSSLRFTSQSTTHGYAPSLAPAFQVTPLSQDVFTPSMRPTIQATHFGNKNRGVIKSEPTDKDKKRNKQTLQLLAKYQEYAGQGQENEAIKIRNEIVKLNMGLVTKIARSVLVNTPKNPHATLEDFTQVATLGLIRAIERFDCSQGLAFSTLATPTIRGKLLNYIRDKVGDNIGERKRQELLTKVKKLTKQLQHPDLSEEERKAITDKLAETKTAASNAALKRSLKLDAPWPSPDGKKTQTLADTLPAPETTLSYDMQLIKLLNEHAKDIFPKEKEREKALLFLNLRFEQGLQMKDIAEQLNLSRPSMTRLEKQYLKIIRVYLERHPLKGIFL